MKYENKSFSVGMPRVTQEQWDAIFAKKRRERQPSCRKFRCLAGGPCPQCDPPTEAAPDKGKAQ